jgi:pimeloyl-ACP methyl ester carboxylesterase
MPHTFVLVHGAWHGGWCWRRVADILESKGHKVFAPTLTGLGEREHLMRKGIDLATHIADVVNVFRFEDLHDAVLCGHSYAGFVISGAAEQVAERIGSIVYLDAFYPEDGERMVDITGPQVREATLAAADKGEISVAPRPAEAFKVNEKDRAWVDAMCRPHPIGTMIDPIRVTGAHERIAKKGYIRARDYPNPGFDKAVERLKPRPGWRFHEAACGHDVMVDMPDWLAERLVELA